MTGRSQGSLQQTKHIWYSTCNTCLTSIMNKGSGAPRKYCSQRCRAKSPARLKQMRIYAKKSYKPKHTKNDNRVSNKTLLNAEKRLRNECALHVEYWGVQKFVIHGYEYLMDMDHLDRKTKIATIAKMMGSGRTREGTPYNSSRTQRFIDEMAKCQMLCMDCHRRKTVENRDWVLITKPLEPMIVKIYNQPSLFDIDPT